MEDKISYDDVKEYQHLFMKVPAFLLERMAKKNSNLVSKFRPAVEAYLGRLNAHQKNKLDIVLNSKIEDLQAIMGEAHRITNKKQYKILANPKYREFIELNLNEIRKLI